VSSDDEVVNTVRVQQLDELFQISLQLVQGMRGASVRVRVRYRVVLEGSKRDKTRHRRVRHPQRRCRPQELVPFGESNTESLLDPGLVGRRRRSLACFGRRLRPGTPRRRRHIVNGLAKSARRRVVDSSCARLLALVLRGTAERRRPAAQLRETIGGATRAHFIFGGARAESCIVSNPANGGIVSPS
jgi:hypothetical protein